MIRNSDTYNKYANRTKALKLKRTSLRQAVQEMEDLLSIADVFVEGKPRVLPRSFSRLLKTGRESAR